jgi:hypothetical protein
LKWKYSTNDIKRIKYWANQRRGFEEFSSEHSLNPRIARHGGAIELQQSIGEAQKNLRKCKYSASEVIRIENWNN